MVTGDQRFGRNRKTSQFRFHDLFTFSVPRPPGPVDRFVDLHEIRCLR